MTRDQEAKAMAVLREAERTLMTHPTALPDLAARVEQQRHDLRALLDGPLKGAMSKLSSEPVGRPAP